MDELIFQFLLQAGYPRASIVADTTLVAPGGGGAAPADAPTYVIVDPETADCLAVIDVVEALEPDALQRVAERVGQYARQLGGRDVQGYLIRVDPQGDNDAEQVQFFRVWPNRVVQQLSAKTFPDLDGLRITRRLSRAGGGARGEVVGTATAAGSAGGAAGRPSGGAGRWLPGIALALLGVADWYLVHTRGTPLVSVAESLLAVGAATLLTLSALTGRVRD